MLYEFVMLGTEVGSGITASWGAVSTWVKEERTRTGENEGQNAQADHWENKS